MYNIICAWCKKGIGFRNDLPPGVVSHGVCRSCSIKHFGSQPGGVMDWYGRITLLIPDGSSYDKVQETADRIIKEQGGETDGGGMSPGSHYRDVFYSAKTEKAWDLIRIAVGNTFKVISFSRSQDETSVK